jgi:hypothetical protein
MGLEDKVKVDNDTAEKQIRFLVSLCVDIDLSSDRLTHPKRVCMECIARLQFIFNFKEFCRINNQTYFMPETQEENNFNIKEEPSFNRDLVIQHESNELIEVFKSESNDLQQYSPRTQRRLEENRKNALRQREKRANESLEEKAIRRQKVAEQARLRRQRKRVSY